MSLKYTAIFALSLLAVSAQETPRKHKHEDPFAIFDRHLQQTLAHNYFWPWTQLVKAAAAFDAEDNLEESSIITDPNKFEVNLNVKRFKPEELRIKVKNRNIIVEGKHKETNGDNQHFVANHFVQRFALPAGCKEDEVSAVLKSTGVLSISAPKHELPPPPPEREVPIQVLLPEEPTTKKEIEVTTTKKEEPTTLASDVQTTAAPALEELDLTKSTAHTGKIKKKELKPLPKPSKQNEVAKGVEENGLDYALIETEE